MTAKVRNWAVVCCCGTAVVAAVAVMATRKDALESDDPVRILKYMGADPSDLTRFERGFRELRRMGTRAIDPIVDYLRKHQRDGDPEWDMAETALECIALVRERDALPRLIELASDRHNLLSLVAVTAIREIATAEDLEALADIVPRRDFLWKARLIEAIGGFDGTQAQETLLKYLKNKDPRIRRGALFGLKRRGDPATLARIRQCFESEKDSEVRITAAEALASLGDETGRKWISKILQTSDKKTLLWRASCAAGRLGGADLTQDLVRLLGHENSFVGRLAGEALMNIGGPGELSAIEVSALDEIHKKLLKRSADRRPFYSHDRGFMDWEYDLIPGTKRIIWVPQNPAP